jgi:SAM-dependent methyltransferase
MCEALNSLQLSNATVLQGDAAKLPFADYSFDFLIANHMLYHVDDPDVVLKEFARVLRPNGKLYVSLTGREHMAELMALSKSIDGQVRVRKNARMVADNAMDYLSKDFVDVVSESFPGDLEVLEPEPVLAYLESLNNGEVIASQKEAVRRAIQDQITTKGCFRIQKHVVLFTARRP